jgi:hypothetical protein
MKTRILNALLWALSMSMFISMVYAPALWRWINGG